MLTRNVAKLVGGNWVNTLLGAVLGIYVARRLGPENKGVYALAVGASAILSAFASWGCGHSTSYFVRKRPGAAWSIVAHSTLVSSLGTCIVGVFLYYSGPLFSELFFDGRSLDGAFLILILLGTILLSINGALGAGVIAKQDSGFYSLAGIASTCVSLGTTLLFMEVLRGGVLGALGGFMSGQLLLLILYIGRFRLYVKPEISTPLPFSEFISYASKAQPGVMVSVVFKRVDLFVVGYFLNPAFVGYYSVAAALKELVMILPRAVAGLVGGELAGIANPDQRAFWGPMREGLISSITFSIVASLGGAIMFPFIIPLLYGPAYNGATVAAIILVTSAVPMSAAILFNAALNALNKPLVSSVANLVSSVCGFLLLWFGAKFFGLTGAALAAVFSTGILSLMYWTLYARVWSGFRREV